MIEIRLADRQLGEATRIACVAGSAWAWLKRAHERRERRKENGAGIL
jgi:hypothetical protein